MELNTDRMLMAIAAILLGVGFVFGVKEFYPDAMGVWSHNSITHVRGMDVSSGSDVGLSNGSFDDGLSGWSASGVGVNASNGRVRVPGGSGISTTVDLPVGGDIQVMVSGRGLGSMRIELGSNTNVHAFTDVSILNNIKRYSVKLSNEGSVSNRLGIQVSEGSDIIIDDISIIYLGNAK